MTDRKTQSPTEKLAALSRETRNEFLQSLSEDECEDLLYKWRGFFARPNQLPPVGEWDIWLILAGRGFGKTRAGAEWIREKVYGGARRIALVAETQKDLEEVMIEGNSGVLSVFPPARRPRYQKKPVRLMFDTGAVALGYNATQPDQLRGPQFDVAWCDELAKWRYARETWDQLQFGMRLGETPQQLVTTTPRPIEVLKSILNSREGRVHVTRGRTVDNRSNLAPSFLRKIKARYAGTVLGQQELEGEVLDTLPGGLWKREQIDATRIDRAPEDLERILISIDPAMTHHRESNEHGLIVVGTCHRHGYVLEDASLKGSPLSWARRAVELYDIYAADGIVVEVNQGGDMVAQTIRSVRDGMNIIQVRATRGKHVRAEPVAALYEQKRVHHVGNFPELENQMSLMTSAGFEGDGSPDRLDALVWAIIELFPAMLLETSVKIPHFSVRHVV
ncbi:MAG: terminase family protein [Alphaproteobacteria bacterium]|nr:terminase family protein [Alphaproteobacteria bacterium]